MALVKISGNSGLVVGIWT